MDNATRIVLARQKTKLEAMRDNNNIVELEWDCPKLLASTIRANKEPKNWITPVIAPMYSVKTEGNGILPMTI
jgi:hypothetical protein